MLLGFAQTLTAIRAGKIVASSNAQVSYGLDAAGNLVSNGLRSLDYDTAGRLNQVRSSHVADARITRYLHNALGQRVFKSEAQSANTAISNNCGNPVQQCLNAVGAGVGNSVLPSSILENLRSSPNSNGNVSYPSPRPSSGFGGGLVWR